MDRRQGHEIVREGEAMTEKSRLGRGLDALIGSATASAAGPGGTRLPVVSIQTNPNQPRKTFDDEDLEQLTQSIRQHGVLQPLLVRESNGEYQLIAGERRLRAARSAGLHDVPVHLVNFNDQEVFEAALIENVQRADLNPIEKAQGFRDYLERFQMTHEQLAQRLGLERSTITNLLGLLNLPPEVQEYVRLGQLTLGHAKALKGLPEPERQVALCKDVIAKNLSVHALELLVKQMKSQPSPSDEPPPAAEAAAMAVPEKTAHVQAIEDEIRQRLTVRVAIKLRAKHKGQVVLGFENTDDFERIVDVLRKAA
jgi:ParB family chromosome partitioning protein